MRKPLTTVYVVTWFYQEEYERHVENVFTSRAGAERYIEERVEAGSDRDDFEIEEMPLFA
jgi:hypothetical protein